MLCSIKSSSELVFYICLIDKRKTDYAEGQIQLKDFPIGKQFFPLPLQPDHLCGPPSCPSNENQELLLFRQEHILTPQLHVAPKLRKLELYLHSSTYTHDMVLRYRCDSTLTHNLVYHITKFRFAEIT